jgi:hypothetical protein
MEPSTTQEPERDSPSQRVTAPMASPEFADVDDDEGDRNDGENWFENNVEQGALTRREFIDDEPTAPHNKA